MTKVGGEIQGRTGVLNSGSYDARLQVETQETPLFRTHAYAVFGRSGKKSDYSDEYFSAAWRMQMHETRATRTAPL